VWVVGVVTLMVIGLAASPRCRRALPLLVVAIVALPVVFEAPRLNTTGVYWQGRYWLPLLVGIPLLASTALPSPSRIRLRGLGLGPAAVLAAGLVLGGAQLAAFLTALHRYQHGLGGRPQSGPGWSPPGGSTLVVAMLIAGEALLVGLAAWAATEPTGAHRRDPSWLNRLNLRS
jgi:hypothetical protein